MITTASTRRHSYDNYHRCSSSLFLFYEHRHPSWLFIIIISITLIHRCVSSWLASLCCPSSCTPMRARRYFGRSTSHPAVQRQQPPPPPPPPPPRRSPSSESRSPPPPKLGLGGDLSPPPPPQWPSAAAIWGVCWKIVQHTSGPAGLLCGKLEGLLVFVNSNEAGWWSDPVWALLGVCSTCCARVVGFLACMYSKDDPDACNACLLPPVCTFGIHYYPTSGSGIAWSWIVIFG